MRSWIRQFISSPVDSTVPHIVTLKEQFSQDGQGFQSSGAALIRRTTRVTQSPHGNTAPVNVAPANVAPENAAPGNTPNAVQNEPRAGTVLYELSNMMLVQCTGFSFTYNQSLGMGGHGTTVLQPGPLNV